MRFDSSMSAEGTPTSSVPRRMTFGSGSEHNADLGLDESGLRSPAQLRHRSHHEAAGLDREGGAERVENLRCGIDRILREQHQPGRTVANILAEGVGVDAPLDCQQTAQAAQREAEAELDLGQEVHADYDHERERRVRADQSDRSDPDLGELQVEYSTVYAGVLFVAQETSAFNHAGVHPQTRGIWRLGLDRNRPGAVAAPV